MKRRAVVNLPALLESCTPVSLTMTAQASRSTGTLPTQGLTTTIEPLAEESNVDNTAGVAAPGGLADNDEPSSDVDCAMDHPYEAEKQRSCTAATASAKTASTASSTALIQLREGNLPSWRKQTGLQPTCSKQ